MGVFAAMVPVAVVVENAWMNQWAEMGICIITAMIVLRMELTRRLGDGSPGLRYGFSGSIEGCKQVLKHCGPEVAGVAACSMLALVLRLRGDVESTGSAEWEEIKSQWPLLLTADTLLCFQSMLRLVVLGSVLLRAGARPIGPLGGEVAALFMGANIARGLLAWKSSNYMLDGPLGGNLPGFCDIAAIPMLAALVGLRNLRRCPVVVLTVGIGVSWLSSRHNLNLAAADANADSLFIAAHMFDTLAALTYLVRSILISENDRALGCVKVGFTHLLMAAQQSLSTYYFLHAFDKNADLVGAGCPFEVLQIGNVVQLGTYFAAAVIFVAEHLDSASEASDSARVPSGSDVMDDTLMNCDRTVRPVGMIL